MQTPLLQHDEVKLTLNIYSGFWLYENGFQESDISVEFQVV